jgi:hypothetical protein
MQGVALVEIQKLMFWRRTVTVSPYGNMTSSYETNRKNPFSLSLHSYSVTPKYILAPRRTLTKLEKDREMVEIYSL